MTKEINEKIIKITGSGCIDKELELELGDDIDILIKGNVVKIEDSDNQDGTYDKIMKIKIITVEKIRN